MSIDIRIDSYDISDMDERLDRAFDIRNGWGADAVSDDNVMCVDNVSHFPQGSIHAVMQMQQCQIFDQQNKIDKLLKHIMQLDDTVKSITQSLDNASKNLKSFSRIK